MYDKWCFLSKVLIVLICLSPFFSTSQHDPFAGKVLKTSTVDLNEAFDAYQVYSLDIEELSSYVQSESYDDHISLVLPGYGEFEIDLYPNPLKAPHYSLRLQTESGVKSIPNDGIVKTFKGYLKGGQYEVRLTIDDDFINGFIELPKDLLYFESMRFRQDGAPSDQVLVYRKSSITEDFHLACDMIPSPAQSAIDKLSAPTSRAVDACLEVEIAIADDWLMYDDNGQSVTDLENLNISVLNNVQTNFDDEFANELMFSLVEIFISTCSTCDPWSSSTNSNTLLNSFTSWGPTGFSATHDVASLWTDRNFNGPTVGVAWLGGLCTSFRYNILEDFTSNLDFLRVLQSHELGHNFGAGHSSAGTIMASSLNITNVWSGASVNQINSFVSGINCLEECPGGEPPVASITSDIQEGCNPLVIEFTDLSVGQPDAWAWEFEGGSPGISSVQNPVITYFEPGTYDVTLEVFNGAGSDIISLANYVEVLPDPIADFIYSEEELTVFFENLSLNSDAYLWEFGDGNMSTDVNPVHTYDTDGSYDVILTVSGICGDVEYMITVEVVSSPIAGFTFEPGEGCVPLDVEFFNASSNNVDEFNWDFEGGNPEFSSLENPIVTFNNPGLYSVTLSVSNEAGVDVEIFINIISVNPLPTSDFDASVFGSNVVFTNLSQNAFLSTWDFGDGNMSNVDNPEHDYQEGGQYTVMLISENECGSDTAFLEISVASAAIAGFELSQSIGCGPLQVEYTSTGFGDVDVYEWSFPGGNPAVSSQMNPVVTYITPGTYDAQLIVTNAVGADTLFMTNVVTVIEPVVGAFTYFTDGASVSFFNESTGTDSQLWEIAGVAYNEENPAVNFAEDGVYEAQLIVYGPCGSDTVIQNITISTPPVAGIGAASTGGCEPSDVQFTDESSSNVLEWDWSFPGGTPSTSNAQNPLITYLLPGVYSVSLTVTNAEGIDDQAIDNLITVDPRPASFFNTVQSGTVIEFQNISTDATSFLWLFGDGESSGEVNPIHDYGKFGEFQVLLIAINDCGSDTMVVDLQLVGLPVPWFTAAMEIGCAPFEVEFIDASQNGAVAWEWSFPGGDPASSNAQNPMVEYSSPGLYDITLKVSNIAGAQSLLREEYIEVGGNPVAMFSAQSDEVEVTFLNESLDAEAYLWDFGDGQTDSTEHPVHTYSSTGTYTVELIVYNLCGSDTFYMDVSVQTTALTSPSGLSVDLWPNPNNGVFNIDLQGYEGDMELTLLDVHGRVVYHKTIHAPAQLEVGSEGNLVPGLYHALITGRNLKEVKRIVVQ